MSLAPKPSVRRTASEPDEEAFNRTRRAILELPEACVEPLVVTDRDARLIEVHPGKAPLAFPARGESLLEHIAAEHHDAVEAAFRATVDHGSAGRVDVPLQSHGGKLRWFQAALTPVTSSDERVVGVLWQLSDVTPRRKEEERLRLSESMMTDTQGVAHLGTWEWDPKDPHATWSPELYRIYGLDESHVPSFEDYLERVHPEDRQRVIDATNGVFKDHRPYSHDERIFRPDGTIRWLHTWAQAVKDEDGRLLRLVGVCQDITERKTAELEVAQRLQEKEVMLKEIHHRVKNNLQVVASLLNLQSNASTSSQVKASLGEARDRVRSMALVHETLYQSGLLSKIDLFSYVRALARESARSQVGASDHPVRLSVEGQPLEMNMEQAVSAGLLVNELVSNAYKHAFPGGRSGSVSIDVRPQDESHVIIQVKDDGVGMPSDARNTRGVGLRLVDALVRQLRGTIEWKTEGGTTAVVTIPLMDVAA